MRTLYFCGRTAQSPELLLDVGELGAVVDTPQNFRVLADVLRRASIHVGEIGAVEDEHRFVSIPWYLVWSMVIPRVAHHRRHLLEHEVIRQHILIPKSSHVRVGSDILATEPMHM